MSKRKLLLADDSLTIQKVVNLTFTDEGFEVHTVGDGDAALAKIAEIEPDIVLADVVMPGPNGYQICASMRQNGSNKDTPVILLVGSFEPFDEQEAANVGANAFLTKPFQSIRQLVLQVNELLAAGQQRAAETVPAEEPVVAAESSNAPEDVLPGEYGFEQPPAGADARSAPDDIETLYERSFGDAADSGQFEGHDADLSDGGLDDQMIETSYLSSAAQNDTLDFDIETPLDQPAQPDDSHAGMEREISGYYEASEPEEVPAYDLSSGSADPGQQEDRSENASETFAPTSGYEQETSSFQTPSPSYPAYSDETPTEDAEPEAREFVEQPPQVMSDDAAEGMPSPFDSIAVPEQSGQAGVETASFDRPTPAGIFDDIDLLDLPPSGADQTVELTTAERAELMGSNKRVVSLSPELMEMIVQQVVERISRKY